MATAAAAALNPELAQIRQELEQATEQTRKFVESCDDQAWARKPSAKGWSAAECVIHLNKTSETALPLLRKGIAAARAQNRVTNEPYRLDFIGRQVLKFTEPPYRLRAPSPASYNPTVVEPRAAVLSRFEQLQSELIDLLQSADGLDLCQIKVAWAVYVRIRYNMFASFKILPAHQRRHLWQAEQAAKISN